MTSLAWIAREDPRYAEERQLRWEVLRRPLGMPVGSEENPAEAACLHLVATVDDAVVGCVIWRGDADGTGQLMQMVVADAHQGRGIGRQLVRELERRVRAEGYTAVVLHARETARGFYQRLGYEAFGERFVEVGLPHVMMRRAL